MYKIFVVVFILKTQNISYISLQQLWTNEPILELCTRTKMPILPTYMRRRMSSNSSHHSHSSNGELFCQKWTDKTIVLYNKLAIALFTLWCVFNNDVNEHVLCDRQMNRYTQDLLKNETSVVFVNLIPLYDIYCSCFTKHFMHWYFTFVFSHDHARWSAC